MDAAANITIGDVAGSGVRAAVVVGRIRSALRACTVHGLVYFRCAHRLRRRPRCRTRWLWFSSPACWIHRQGPV